MSSVLPDPKLEAFALLIATGQSIADSYTSAIEPDVKNKNTASVKGQRIKSRPDVQIRIGELRQKYEEQQESFMEVELTNKVTEIETNFFAKLNEAIDDSVKTRNGRVHALCARRSMIYKLMDERSQYYDHRDVPGGRLGIVVTNRKQVGNKIVKTHTFDLELFKELREIEKQIAIELGQWTEKREDAHIIKTERDIPDEVLEEMVAKGRRAELEAQAKELPASETTIDVEPSDPD